MSVAYMYERKLTQHGFQGTHSCCDMYPFSYSKIIFWKIICEKERRDDLQVSLMKFRQNGDLSVLKILLYNIFQKQYIIEFHKNGTKCYGMIW